MLDKKKIILNRLRALRSKNEKVNLFLYKLSIEALQRLEINLNGNLKSLNKLPSKMNTHPIIVDSALLYINNSNKLISIN